MLYPEAGKWLDKPRLLLHEGLYHLFYVQGRERAAAPTALARATSPDLLSWEKTSLLLEAGAPGSWDDLGIGAAAPIMRDGVCYLLYTGRGQHGDAGLGLVWTEDWLTWKSHPHPVLRPDPQWYESTGEAMLWRDPVLWHNPFDGSTYAFLAARTVDHAGCIAMARSQDLLQWEVLPPAYAPDLGQLQTPDIFPWQDSWIMTFGCCDGAETRFLVSDNPLQWDSKDTGALLLGGESSLDTSLCTAPTLNGAGSVHVSRVPPGTPAGGGEPRTWLALPKTLSGAAEQLALTMRSDLYTAPIDCFDCEKLVVDQMECWHTDGDVITATSPGGRTFLPLPPRGNRTASALIAIEGTGEGGYVVGSDDVIVALTSDGHVVTRTGEGIHSRSWDVGGFRGELSVALVDRHVEVYFNRRFLGTACAVEPGEKTLALFCSGTLSIVFSGVAVKTFELHLQHQAALLP